MVGTREALATGGDKAGSPTDMPEKPEEVKDVASSTGMPEILPIFLGFVATGGDKAGSPTDMPEKPEEVKDVASSTGMPEILPDKSKEGEDAGFSADIPEGAGENAEDRERGCCI
jgi:hypothetical protein